jgi:hypothetical protein
VLKILLAELGTLSGMSVHGVSKAIQRMSVRLNTDRIIITSHHTVI